MRTTITIDDGLLAEIKRRAAETGSTVSRLIGDSLRLTMNDQDQAQACESFELVTYGRGGRFSRHNLDKTSALLELDDVARFGQGDR